jgi:succinoglycan biosynthesis protein ExoM
MNRGPDDPYRETGIDICVCTYRRPHLERTLRSLGLLDIPAGVVVRIVVADNDAMPSARDLVERVAAELLLDIHYVHCPAANISLARNACLDACEGEYVAFIDDDSTASREWLAGLVETAELGDVDAVLGPVRAVYPVSAPGWMQRGDFHSTVPVWVGGRIRTGYSGNALLRRASPYVVGRRFNLALGSTGGEDTEYFAGLHDTGGVIAYAPHAIAYEPVTEERTRFAWLARRAFRSGQTHGRLLGARRSTQRLTEIGLAAAKVVYCLAAAAGVVVVPHLRNRHALRAVMHAGAVSGLLGVREIRLYADGSAERRGHAA